MPRGRAAMNPRFREDDGVCWEIGFQGVPSVLRRVAVTGMAAKKDDSLWRVNVAFFHALYRVYIQISPLAVCGHILVLNSVRFGLAYTQARIGRLIDILRVMD